MALPPLHRFELATWRRRALFIVGGVVVGILAVTMAALADRAQLIFAGVTSRWAWAPMLVTPLGFALCAYLTRRFFPGSQGSGIPQVIAARKLDRHEDRARLVSLRLGLGKIALLMLGLLSGASIGREGPTVQVGAATMFLLGRLEPHRQPGLLLAGSAAGIAAAFNAPLAGIIFGIEEMSRSFEQRSSVLVLVTVIVAGLTSMALLGDYTYFGVGHGTMIAGWQWLAVPLVVVVGGLLGGVFSRVVVVVIRSAPPRLARITSGHPVLFAAFCGLLVALCGAGSGDSIFGTGYAQAQAILNAHQVPWLFGPLKLLATALSTVSGIPGGIFSPSLAVGAGLAYNLSALAPGVPIDTLAILCMAAYLAGVVQAPLTSAVIVSEMTADHSLILPIMICALGASAVSRLVSPEGIYHALAAGLLPEDPAAPAPVGEAGTTG
ncbi:MAG TPA: chloride channel protein [Devosia sp.]|nr:chloride channel protein [Devosia sp.]